MVEANLLYFSAYAERNERPPISENGARNGNFEILRPYDFLQDFTDRAAQAEERVWMQSMYFEADKVFGAVAPALINASGRSVDSRLHVDYFTHMLSGGKINFIPSPNPVEVFNKRRRKREKAAVIDDLTSAGVSVDITNTPRSIGKFMPQAGRNHIKLAFVDDVAWIGGLNLSENDFGREDFMIRITDPRIVDPLAEQFQSINDKRPTADYERPCTEDTVLLVDAGIRGSSIILDRAIEKTRAAQHSVGLVTQITPDGVMRDELAAASEVKDVEVVISAPDQITERAAKFFDRANWLAWKRKGTDVPIAYFPNWVHVKMLLTDREHPDLAEVIVGSNNFLRGGVRWGTEEIALQSTNPTLLANLTRYYEEMKATALTNEPRAQS